MLLACSLLRAADRQLAVVVWYEEKEVYSFFVSDNPQITVENGYANIKSDGEWTYYAEDGDYIQQCFFSIPMSESTPYHISFEQRSYTGYTYENSEEYITDVETPQQAAKPQFSMKDGVLHAAGLEAEVPVSICTVDGKVLGSTKADKAGNARLQMPQHNGAAVVKAGSITAKILLR